jgi:fumarylacetoacetase
MNETHDPSLRSFVPSAELASSDFPLQNLPFGSFRRRGSTEAFRGGVAIGDQIVDLGQLHGAGLLDGAAQAACAACLGPVLNPLLALGQPAWSALRLTLSRLLRHDAAQRAAMAACLVPAAEAELALSITVGDYTDFYASIHHATRVGRLFRPDQPLMPNYVHLPVAYHGRSSSVVVSGTPVVRPMGQVRPAGAEAPSVRPSARLDYELELGVVIGTGNPLGTRIGVEDAESHIFGLCLLNDWSARDIQGWEYQPLGPFAGKNFATTLSPWIVTLEALLPFRRPWQRDPALPALLPYLDGVDVRRAGAIEIRLETRLQTDPMRARGDAPVALARASFCDTMWTIGQMVAHHTLNGCALRPGDVLGTGTISGPELAEAGCLLELTAGGAKPYALPDGDTRTFLQDGDTVELSAFCAGQGAKRIGFGSARGTVVPARSGGLS